MVHAQPDVVATCAAACSRCYAACREAETATAGSQLGRDSPELAGLLRDCAEVVDVAANMLLRRSAYSIEVGTLAELVSGRCAEASARIGDPQLEACTRAARGCTESCASLIAHLRGGAGRA